MTARRETAPGAQRKLWRLGAALAASAALHATVLGAIGPAMRSHKVPHAPTIVYARTVPIQAVSAMTSMDALALDTPAGTRSAVAALPAGPG